ncbi:MAG: O-antigen ligase family protein [Cyanobacteria bacterium CRU_2_1]|nr:O-antigen ligase family protein [Cyanobacteria bacterium RU_5_0]NJR60471.1 O-antigen ligase family protein [Cyanobacteria bacterium CRU_2_1]
MNKTEKPAWAAILGLSFFSALCLLVGFSSILNYAFPAGCLAVGIFLYWRYPILYLGFNWWVWFLSPLIARIVEYQNGWTDPGLRLIILSPYLVTMLTAGSFFQYLPRMMSWQDGLPFGLAFTGVFYALFVGLFKSNSTVAIVQDLLTWLPAIFLGSHLVVNWRQYPSYRQNTQRVFGWAVLVMGIYGVVQYAVAPEWDRFWLRNAETLQLCCGQPEPFMIRVWSTLNYPFTFAYAMMAALLLLLSNPTVLNSLALVSGFISFLLSLVRGAWIGWIVGLLIFFMSLKSQLKARLLLTIVVIGALLSVLTTLNPFADAVTSRFQSLSDVQSDHSVSVRATIYANLINSAVSEIVGRGMGGQGIIDAGFLDVLVILGWFGVILYGSGILMLFFNLFQGSFQGAKTRSDPFISAACAVVCSILVGLPANNTLVLLPGVLFWGFAGMAIAARTYYQHQKRTTKILSIDSQWSTLHLDERMRYRE